MWTQAQKRTFLDALGSKLDRVRITHTASLAIAFMLVLSGHATAQNVTPASTATPVVVEDADLLARPVPPPPGAGLSSAERQEARQVARPSRPAELSRSTGRMGTRLRLLEGNLRALRTGPKVLDGVLTIASGALAITLGAIYDDTLPAEYLYLSGSATAARGILDLALSPNTTEESILFENLPEATRAEIRAKLAFGEDALQSASTRAKILRLSGSSLSMAVGVAVIPLWFFPRDFEVKEPMDYFVLIGAGVSVLTGLIDVFQRSEAEQRWDAYAEAVEASRQPRRAAASEE